MYEWKLRVSYCSLLCEKKNFSLQRKKRNIIAYATEYMEVQSCNASAAILFE